MSSTMLPQPLCCELPLSPSLFWNNLAAAPSSQQQQVAFGHISAVCVSQTAAASGGGGGQSSCKKIESSFSADAAAVVTGVAWVDLGASFGGASAALVVCSSCGVELYAAAEQSGFVLRHARAFSETPANPFARCEPCGVCFVPGMCAVLVGSCLGVVHVFTLCGCGGGGWKVASDTACVQTALGSVTCMAAAPAPLAVAGCDVAATWAVADDSGAVAVYGDDTSRGTVALFPYCNSPCTGLAFMPGGAAVLASAFATGHVRLFSLDSHSMLCEIAAHSRAITSLCVHPTLPLVATVSEDSWLRVWHFPVTSISRPQKQQQPVEVRVALLHSAFRKHTLWVGAQFLQPPPLAPSALLKSIAMQPPSIAVVAYDDPQLYVFRIPASAATTPARKT